MMNDNEFSEELKKKTGYAEEAVRKFLPEETGFQKTVIEASNYSVLAGGKRLRPVLMNEIYRIFGGKSDIIEYFMAAIEYIHSSSLVHDDLPCMDNDEFRRGKKSTWACFGEDMGVLAGDALLMYAIETASRAFGKGTDERVGKAINILTNKTGIYGMIGGQTLDVLMTGKPLDRDMIDFIYRLKTGALIEASMTIGAVLAGADSSDIALVENLAGKIGYAFQIKDDILDVTSTTEILGKPVHSDEKNEKTTFVTLYGLKKTEEYAARFTEEAIMFISMLPGNTEFLKKLTEYLLKREK